MELGFWGIQGRAEYLRWLIAYLALDVTEVNPPSMEAWQELKAELKVKQPFINLPYFKVGNNYYSESLAVAEAIVTRAGRIEMIGKGDQDRITHTMLRSVLKDVLQFTYELWNFQSVEDIQHNLAGKYEQKLVPVLEALTTHLGSKPFLMYYVTIADFELGALSLVFDYMEEQTGVQSPFKSFPSLVKLISNLKALPGLSQYLHSSKGPHSRPVMAPYMIKWL